MESALHTKSLPQSWSRVLKLGPPKNKEKSVKTVSETGPSCWAVRILNCVQEMGDKWLTQIGVSFTYKVSSTVLICDPIKSLPQSWSVMLRHGPPKKQREECENCFGTGLSCWAVRILNCVQEIGAKWLTQIGVSFTYKVSSTVLICDAKTWSTQKTKRRVWKLFRNWTVMLSCRYLELCTRDGWQTVDSYWSRLHPLSLFHSLDLWC